MTRLLISIAALLLSAASLGADEPYFRFDVHGRTPLHVQSPDSVAYGLLGTAIWNGERAIVTVSAMNVSAAETTAWLDRLDWTVLTEAGQPVSAAVARHDDSPTHAPHHLRLRGDVHFANFEITGLSPGRYIVELAWTDPNTGKRRTSERRELAIYKGDETPFIRSFFLREQAQKALAAGTADSFERARRMLLEAANGNTDPSVYEELADASLSWTAPDQTLAYYQQSLDIARRNLEKHHGPKNDWSAKVLQLYEPRLRKVEAFRKIVPYYRQNFDRVRVVLLRDGRGGKFAVERRSDGARLRVVDPQQR